MEGVMSFEYELRGFDNLKRRLSDMEKRQIPFATSLALNSTARLIRKEAVKEMKSVFDRPTRWTLASLQLKMSTKKKLVSRVEYKAQAGRYLSPEVSGGPRELKPYEKALWRFGVLPTGYYTVPGAGAKINKAGNMSPGQITQILTGVNSLPGMSDTEFYGKVGGFRKRSKKTANYFVVKKKLGGLVPGIYIRLAQKRKGIRGLKDPRVKQKGLKRGKFYSVIQGRRVRPVLIFVKGPPRYKKRLPFFEIARKTIDKYYAREFDKAFAHAMRTAR